MLRLGLSLRELTQGAIANKRRRIRRTLNVGTKAVGTAKKMIYCGTVKCGTAPT